METGMSAALLRSVAAARADHDRTCRFGGRAVEVHLNPTDAERLRVEDGEDLCGLTARRDDKLGLGRLRIYCDLELDGAPPRRAIRSSRTPLPAHRPAYDEPPVPIEMPLAGGTA
jgi:hypothetical protein